MKVHEIKYLTFIELFSEIGGFNSNIFSFLKIVSSIVLPYLFMRKISNQLLQKLKNKNVEYESETLKNQNF